MGELLITLLYFILFNYLSACGRQVHMQTIIRIVYKLKFDTQSTILWGSQVDGDKFELLNFILVWVKRISPHTQVCPISSLLLTLYYIGIRAAADTI